MLVFSSSDGVSFHILGHKGLAAFILQDKTDRFSGGISYKPSPTLVTDPTMPATDLCHPYLDRPLSIQEYKRIQEFPDDWKLFGSIKDKYRQIGNAVPVSLGKAIGKEILTLLEGNMPPSPPEGFPFSRYRGTDERSFKKEMRKKQMKENREN